MSGNRAFCDEVTKWAFHERGVLRVTNMHHKCACPVPSAPLGCCHSDPCLCPALSHL